VPGEQAAAVGTNALTVERSAIPSYADGWKREGQSRIVRSWRARRWGE